MDKIVVPLERKIKPTPELEGSAVVIISSQDNYEQFVQNNERGIMCYGTPSCDACTLILPLYIRIANRYKSRVTMGYTDIEKCGLQFPAIPYFVAYYKGNEVREFKGASDHALRELVKYILKYVLERDIPDISEVPEIELNSDTEIYSEKAPVFNEAEIRKIDTQNKNKKKKKSKYNYYSQEPKTNIITSMSFNDNKHKTK